ncbi:MAG TPA: hypothetical protein VGM90_35575 [Kofleriaceae bacterium]|jgi:hypothetical protein
MRAAWLILVLGGSACGFSVNGGQSGDAGPIDTGSGSGSDDGGNNPTDGGPDAPLPDANPGATCVGTYKVVCVVINPAPMDFNTAATIDTTPVTGSALCQSPMAGSTVGDVCVIAFQGLALNNTLRVIGSRPLVLIGKTSLTINGSGVLDASSKSEQPQERGPGGRSTCTVTTPPSGNSGGGPGGTYAAAGGFGGDGGGGSNGGLAGTMAAFGDLIGGCNGIDGSANTASDRGRGGTGGGAVLLYSENITINGSINASGARGTGGLKRAGGGGGGSGGTIVLDGPLTVNGSGRVWAQGAGGGEGGDNGTVRGAAGSNPTTSGTAAAGGSGGTTTGGNGGSGAIDTFGGAGDDVGDGGGGGGGGGGYIRYTAMTPTLGAAIIHPAPVRIP